ncbi:hypothetical protein PPTG_22384 [Phytophthora nicotianae INRA-310]|uniref:Helitron helicase-like domain-containing protein n=1 Tax=Phytophthora nicotianae (strain INRA-310) TaxID=761204 RepID=W2QHK9_PHYN3|nr:hypothetical protein PPTG_22384 [Phytophthora nicotianae INRA-310]ETN12662.1 hypothetical protein PPTG_22384 [Phytophthora nicotianae INRA-310]
MFPHLFPYGCGHPGKPRHVPVALNACVRYYSLLSTRRFAEDELFMLASFNYLSIHRMYTQVALKCQRNPTMFEPYGDITERQAFAYQARYGQPALFVTLTPNVAESLVMAQYCGITSVDTLFYAALADPPGRSALHSASVRNDVASARLFMRNMDAFIEHVIGVAPKHMKSKPFDSLFGEVRAYFGMVETQGGGMLHAHFLIWHVDVPPNTDTFYRAMAAHGEQYYRDIEAFTDSIVSTSMPIRELLIPSEAFKDPYKPQRGGNTRGEPVLVRCSRCGTELSSQHVIRRLLLEHRPSSWPPSMRPYSSAEHAMAVRLVTPRRGIIPAAKSAIYRRDLYLFDVHTADVKEAYHEDEYVNYLRDLNRAPHRLEQRENDAFHNDAVARTLPMLPPSISDERWMPRAVAFAVSMLVFLFNMHWWSYVGSCFKKSRAAASGECRYGFPRSRVARSTSSDDGVLIKHRTPFEFVNGFNREIMLAF